MNSSGLNNRVNPVSPSLHILYINDDLISGPIQVSESCVFWTRWPSTTSHNRIKLGIVALLDRLPPIAPTLDTTHLVTESFKVVTSHDLRVHVVQELPATVLVHYLHRTRGRIDQVPVPMVQVYAKIFTEVGDLVFLV